MKKNTIRLVVLLGTVSIIGIILVQIYWVRKAFALKEKEFDQAVQIALRNVADKLAQYGQFSLPAEDIVDRVSSDYYAVNIDNNFDAKTLQYYLESEFDKVGINTDFEYGIYDCSSDKMVYGNYFSSKQVVKNKPTVNFPKLSKFTYYFGVYFPEHSSYVLGKMDIWIITSIILLVVIVFFAYATFVILQQRRLSEIQKDFINNMTHEFKTPISTIAISSTTLADPEIIKAPERLFTYAGIIKEEAERLNKHVEQVLQSAKAERREFKLVKESIDLHKLIRDIITVIGPEVQSKKGTIEFEGEAKEHIINADKQHLTNVILNLLDNALKYSVEIPRIVIRTVNTNHSLSLSVSDNGIGIKKEFQKKIFSNFFRVPSGNIHNVKGFGLGLSYVKSVVRMHGWKIKLESEPGKGSIFTIEIPVEKA